MKKWVLLARWILGLIFLIFGLNGFYLFIPVPPMAPAASEFIAALIATGYMLPFWKSIEVIGGILLLMNRYVPLALAILAPIVANIFFVHLFLDPGGLAIGLLVLGLEVVLVWAYRAHFLPLLTRDGEPR